MTEQQLTRIYNAVDDFVRWLESYGETSQDHQDFYAGKIGRVAKALYYRQPKIGIMAVAPMVFCEAFIPSARKFFYPRMRLPIADAHYAMGFALLHQVTGKQEYYTKAVHFLDVLKQTRCPNYPNYAWGYPFHWQTRNGLTLSGTPLITTTPYCYEAFDYVYRIDGKTEWQDIMRTIAEHVLHDYKDIDAGPQASTCTYTPLGEPGIVNASAYRAFLLTNAWREFNVDKYWQIAERNLNFVLQSQNADGSWPYARDGARDFIDHFHTCFVMKALTKIEQLIGDTRCKQALERGLKYYQENLLDGDNIPNPFARAPRFTVYRRELYDCAECLNLAVLLQRQFPEMNKVMECVLEDLLNHWKKRDGSFRSRKLLVGWDNVPMHRWGQSEIFRSLCFLLARQAGYDPMTAVYSAESTKHTDVMGVAMVDAQTGK